MTTIEKLPRGFTLRHPTMDDAQAALNVINARELAVSGETKKTLEGVRRWWTSSEQDFPDDVWLVENTEGKVIAVASIAQLRYAQLFTGCDVHPDYQQRGIGTYMQRLLEDRAQQFIALAAPDVRVFMTAEMYSTDLATQQLLERHGFQHIRTFWRMGIELQAVPMVPALPAGIEIRTLASDMNLLHGIYEADQDAFRDHWGMVPMSFEEYQHWEVNRESFDPSLWFMAMDGNEIAGISICAIKKQQEGWVHTLGVRRPWRKHGLGLTLLCYSFAELYRRGLQNIYLGVDSTSLTGATRLYEKAGMHVVQQFYRYEKELRAGRELGTRSLED